MTQFIRCSHTACPHSSTWYWLN